MAGKVGRTRDVGIDERVLNAAGRQLSASGYQALSLTAVADEAGTTRQALYRRWPAKADLVTAVITRLSDTTPGTATDSAFTDLVAELADFQRGVSRPGRLSLVGTMLQDATAPDVLASYRARVVAPRRARLLTVLQRGVNAGQLDPDADLEIALTMCTGSWYGRALAGAAAPDDWPHRTATLIWRALGGTTPSPAKQRP